MLERVSPPVIVLDPPEKLVIETRASGGYTRFDWFRNGSLYSLSGLFHVVIPREFPNFFEIFAREPTTTDDLGVYVADLQIGNAPGQIQAPRVQFVVTRYGKDHETSINHIT